MRLLGLLASVVLAASLSSCGSGSGSAPPLRVGVEPLYAPFESIDEKGEFIGLDMDLARAIGKHLGREVKFSNMEFPALIPELEAGRIDMVCSAVSRTAERAERVDFSSAYVKVPMRVLVSTKLLPDARTAADLAVPGISIAVQRGTSGELKASETFKNAKIVQFPTEVDASNELVSGRAHAFVYDEASVVRVHDLHPQETRVLDGDLGAEEYAIAFKKGSPLKAEVDAYLAAARKPGGEVDAIYARYQTELDRMHVRRE